MGRSQIPTRSAGILRFQGISHYKAASISARVNMERPSMP
jgi:hypothetical protein